ncbi:MAG: Gfo/Idh/MocA family oxidoreductase [Micropruina sp.]|uniref:Gfo/Idh/MocA family protein n=1 Tax=Micropruina sp. TaxID=2737536 RepID=UPI0039E3F490
MTDRIRWGLLGAGGIAGTFAENLRTEGLHVQSVAARDGAKAQAFADRFGIPSAHAGYRALVDDPEVDAVYVNTTHNFHAEHALLAIAAGKPVLVEKAFTVTAAQARQVADAARAAGVFAMEAMWTRFLPSTDFVRARIADGSLGEVRAVITDHSQKLNPDPKGRLHNPELAGGALLDLGVYNVSFALDLLGAPSAVIGRGTLTATGVDAEVSMILSHTGTARSEGHATMVSAGPSRGLVIGTDGYLEIDGPFYNWTTVRRYTGRHELAETFEPHRTSRGMHFQALEVERCLREGLTESPRLTLDDSIAVMGVLDELRRQVGCRLPEDARESAATADTRPSTASERPARW